MVDGSGQLEGIDYSHSYAPVVSCRCLRVILAEAVKERWEVHSMDVKTAYINATLKENMFVKIPNGLTELEDPKTHCLKLQEAIYGLKQAGYEWNALLRNGLSNLGWTRMKADHSVYYFAEGATRHYLPEYIDDLVITGPSRKSICNHKKMISTLFDLKDNGICEEVLRLSITQNIKEGWTSIDTSAHIRAFLDYNFPNDNSKRSCPMSPGTKLPEAGEYIPIEHIQRYQSLLGTIGYYAMVSHPELSFSHSMLARYQNGPTSEHFSAINDV